MKSDARPAWANAPVIAHGPDKPVTLERFNVPGSHPRRVFAIEGALVVSDGAKVGRVKGRGVQWMGTLPYPRTVGVGVLDQAVHEVEGRYPDRVDVLYHYNFGRAFVGQYHALTGKGTHVGMGPDGSHTVGLAHLGETTLLATYGDKGNDNPRLQGVTIVTVRGPDLDRHLTPFSARCKKNAEVELRADAIQVAAFGGTPAGTVMAMGSLCDGEEEWAEIWDAAGRSRLVQIGQRPTPGNFRQAWPGQGDELWALEGGGPLVHYRDGTIDKLSLPGEVRAVAALPGKPFHAATSTAVFRLDGGTWTKLADLGHPIQVATLAVADDGALWISTGDYDAFGADDNAVYRLVPAPSKVVEGRP